MNKQILFIISLIGLAAFTRLLPHPPNFTAITAISLFGGAVFSKKIFRFLIPITALFITDIVLNNVVYAEYNEGFTLLSKYSIWVYIPVLITALLAPILIKKINTKSVLVGSAAGSIIFYAISNLGVFLMDPLYTKDLVGFIACYVAAIPFFLNTLTSAVVFSSLLFVSYVLITSKMNVIKIKN